MNNNTGEHIELSIVVPIYNEQESVSALYGAIVQAVEPLGLRFEILFIDDGSRDNTFMVAKRLAENDRRLRIIKFRMNYGQTPAMVAGFDNARGKVVITMDGDLQNDPSDVPFLLSKIYEGYDIVIGWRHKRQDALLTRKVPSRIANWMIGKITGVPIKDNGCSLKAYRASIIKNIPLYSEMHRFIPAMASLAGSRICEIRVKHHARKFGTSKYGLSRIYKVLIDLFSIKTILISASYPGLVFSIFSLLFGCIGLVLWLIGIVQILNSMLQDTIVFSALGLLYISLAIILQFWGLIADFTCRTGNIRSDQFAAYTLRNYNSMN
jgi:glycosyltransferase involved in cell wall biosynthesis